VKRCTNCIIPESAKGIKLDENGLCQLCNDFKKPEIKGLDALKKDIDKDIDKSANPNCIVPVSGGRDSSYALYYAKEKLGLNPIAVHSDNDFETEIASRNLDTMANTLGVPLIRVASKRNILKKIVAEKFKMNAPFGPGLIVDQTCEACKYGFESASYNTARKKGIKIIIWGDSTEESTSNYHDLFEHRIPNKKERLFSSGALSYLKYKYYFKQMKKEYGSDKPDGLNDIHLYDYIEWDRKKIVETIENELGWKKPEESATSWRIDCKLVPLVNYLTTKAYGVSKIELGFSQMIRSGKMDRDDALRQVEFIEGSTNIQENNIFLKDLGISTRQINSISE
jgi:tRNA(Ile)-lysidine synthase TilS/MesJ